MELVINKRTYTLRPVNAERRTLFAEKVLSMYNFQSDDLDSFIKETQKTLKEKHGQDLPFERVKSDFFKAHLFNIHSAIWAFLTPEDKKELGTVSDIDVTKEAAQQFIEWVCAKIKTYSSHVKTSHKDGVSEDIHSVYSHLARVYGWSFEQIKEMDELELMKAIENSVEIMEKEQVSKINAQALAGAYVTGNKQAKTQIDSINRRVTNKSKFKQIAKVNPKMETSISRDQIKQMMEDKNG
jgi:hypothetical protein